MPHLQLDDPGLADLPPSAKLVLWVLHETGPLTPSEIQQETQMPSSTVYRALAQLQAEDVIDATHSTDDARGKTYQKK